MGVLVDQKFGKGLKTTFFNRPVKTTRSSESWSASSIATSIRPFASALPGNRYRLEIEPRLEIPRDANGNLDMAATAQLLNDKVGELGSGIPGAMALGTMIAGK